MFMFHKRWKISWLAEWFISVNNIVEDYGLMFKFMYNVLSLKFTDMICGHDLRISFNA